VSAVLARSGHAIVLPASSGGGKSTLAAALARAGFEFWTDEVAPLTRGVHRVLPAPACLSLKEGAWPVLGPLYPELCTLPVHLRQDGKRVRYLPPPGSPGKRDCRDGLPIGCVVFPAYRPDQPTTLTRLLPAETLCRIAAAGYDAHAHLDNATVTELIDWVSKIDAYELVNASLADAVSRIEGLVL